ncbi:MAG: tetraacyldisaccharide 4'-kinase [Armatimonadetes bacterium]|nr:tetraacyldisaccharide 4'-kinase [Armatimonadota bacterium]
MPNPRTSVALSVNKSRCESARGYFERVIVGEEKGFFSWIFRGLAWPLSALYRVGLAAYLWTYRCGLRKRQILPVPVISVGNLTFGGTGKTPAVEKICRMLASSGKSPAVLSRGGGSKAEGCTVVSDGESVLCSVRECGDEPVLLARCLSGVPIIVGKDRFAAGSMACEKFKPSVIVLDDGFQYWQLHRDLDIVVIDEARPFGSGYVMPMGDLREPICGLRRAQALLINSTVTHHHGSSNLKQLLSKLAPNAELFMCRRRPKRLLASDSSAIDLEWLRGRRVVAFCGIGSPVSFFSMLNSLGAVVCEAIAFPDHHMYSAKELEYLASRLQVHTAEAAVTTAKDAVRLERKSTIPNLYVLEIELEIDDEKRFAELLERVLNRKD